MADIDEQSYQKGRVAGRHEMRLQYAAEYNQRMKQEKDWMLKLETMYYRCGCVSKGRAICGHPGAALHFHHSDQLCDKHAAELAKDGVMYGRT